jgi:pimeloyl-ACP methyl ester carboxylesterase
MGSTHEIADNLPQPTVIPTPSGFSRRQVDLGPGGDMAISYWDNRRDDAALTLLLIHGLFDSKASWRHLCARLHPQFRVVAPDLLGFGDSCKPSLKSHPHEYRYSVSMFARHLLVLIEKLGLRRVVLVGNSLGGAIALETIRGADQLRSNLCGLVLVAAAGYPQRLPGNIRQLGWRAGSLLQKSPLPFLLDWVGITRHVVGRTYRRSFHKPARIPAQSLAETVRILRTPNALYACHAAARALACHNWERTTAHLTRIQLPTLIIRGERDPVVPPVNGDRFVRDIPNARLRSCGSCGHAPQLEAPRLVSRVIGNWIADELQRPKGRVWIRRALTR